MTRLEILEMLQEGQITSDEAVKLLEQLDKQQYEPEYRPSYDWVEDLKENLADAAKNVVDFIANQDFTLGTASHIKQNIESGTVEQMLSFRVTCKNAKVQLEGYSGATIQLDAGYKAKHNRNPHILVEEEKGHYSISYDEQAVYAIGMKIRLPEQMLEKLYIQNANGEIRIMNIQAGNIILDTNNAGIFIDQTTGNQLLADTKNAPIYIKNSQWTHIKCKTTNAKILADGIDSDEVILQTYNAGITTDNSHIRFLSAKTTNAGLRLNHLPEGFTQQYPLYTVEAFTLNGSIKVMVPWTTNFPCKVKATTTFAHVKAEIDNFVEETSGPGLLTGKTTDYDQAATKATLNLKTTNGSIKIMP